MAYNNNYKYQQNQRKVGITDRKESKRELNKQNKFVRGLSDPTWWKSLKLSEKRDVYECYNFCLENSTEDYANNFWIYGDGLTRTHPETHMKVDTPENKKLWEDKIMSILGDKKKIRQMKLKELGI